MTDRLALLSNIFEKGKIFTFSNFLSFMRIALAFYIYQLISEQLVIQTLVIAAVAIISDYADGYFARKWNQISELGKVLDPLSDKLIIALGSIALYFHYGLALWVVILIIGRDVLILVGSILLVTRFPFVTPSRMAGKIAVTVMTLLLLSYLLEIEPAQIPLQVLTVVAILISGGQYALNFYNQYFKQKV